MKKLLLLLMSLAIFIGINGQKISNLTEATTAPTGSLLMVRQGTTGNLIERITVDNLFSSYHLIQGIFNVLDYGAVRDAGWGLGVGTCDSAAFQLAINAASAAGGGTVYVPAGNYLLAKTIGPIIIGSRVRLLCDPLATLWVAKNFSGTALEISSTTSQIIETSIIGAQIRPQDDGIATPTFTGISLKSTGNSYAVYRCLIRDCVVRFAGVAYNLVTTNNGWINWNTFDNIYAEATVSAFKTRESGESLGIDYNNINGLKLQVADHTTIGLDYISGNGNSFVAYQTCDWGLASAGKSGVLANTSRNNYVQEISDEGNGFEDLGTENMVLSSTSATHGLTGTGTHVVMTHNVNPLADVSYGRNYPLVLRNVVGTNAQGTGIAFINGTSSQNYNIGASIIFNKTDAYSKGKLEFYTKQSATTEVAPTKVLTLGDNGRVTIAIAGVPSYADNAAAIAGGLITGTLYRTATGVLMIVYVP